MALTAAQKLTVFEMSHIYYSNNATATIGFNTTNSIDVSALKAALESYLNNLDSASEAKVSAIVTEYDKIINSVGEFEIDGMRFSFAAKRKQLQDRLLIYVPIMDIATAAARASGISGDSLTIPFGR